MPKVANPPLVQEPDGRHRVLGGGLGPYNYLAISEAGGLTQYGAFVEELPPGSRSSFRHWHETEDEMVYVLSGEVVLIEDEETTLRPGEAAAWPAGLAVGHCLENRGDTPARYLIIGTRNQADRYHYPDHDLIVERDGETRRNFHGDGRPRDG